MNAVPLQEDEFQELRQVCCELRERLRAGESARVEELLEIHPLLARNDEAVLELIHAEVSTRNDMGQRPTLEEWVERFPRLLPRMEQIVSLRSVFDSEMPTLSDSSAGTADPLASVQAPDGRLRIGNYQILQEIGRGGMGVVYKARQANLSRVVALKMILAGEHAGLRERARLRNEAQAAAQLMHPNVVQIFEIGEHEGLPFLAMEYVAGGNLTRTLRAMPQAFRWSARLTETMARAIQGALAQRRVPGYSLLHGPGASLRQWPDHWARHRRLRPGSAPLRDADGGGSVPGVHPDGNPLSGHGGGACSAFAITSRRARRPGDHLPEVPGS